MDFRIRFQINFMGTPAHRGVFSIRRVHLEYNWNILWSRATSLWTTPYSLWPLHPGICLPTDPGWIVEQDDNERIP